MKKIFISLFVLFILELLVLIQVGSAIGAFETITFMFISMVIGFVLVKLRFKQVILQMQQMQRIDLSIIWIPLAGFLFIFPGFISDVLALLLLVPPVHSLVGDAYKRSHPQTHFTSDYNDTNHKGRTIEGTAVEEKDDDK